MTIFKSGHRTKLGFNSVQQSIQTRKLNGFAGFFMANEMQ